MQLKKQTAKPVLQLKPDLKPIKQVKLKQNFTIKTINAFGRKIKNKKDFRKCLTEKIGHPVFGPIAITGIKKNSCIEIKIKKIIPNKTGYQCTSFSTGVLKEKYKKRNFKIYKTKNNKIKINNQEITVKPSIGFISTLPPKDIGCGRASKYGGNLDFNQLKEGNSIILPTAFNNAFLLVGDLHLRQGNGEICGIAIECGGKITLEVKKSKIKTNYPIIKTKNKKMLIVGTGKTIKSATKNATKNAINYCKKNLNLKEEDAYLYLSAKANIILGNSTGTIKTCAIEI